MNEPKPFDGPWLLELVGWVVGGLLTGMFAAMAWFASAKRRIYIRMGEVEKDMKDLTQLHASHSIQLVALQTTQLHLNEGLREIKDRQENTNLKLDQLSKTLTDVLVKKS